MIKKFARTGLIPGVALLFALGMTRPLRAYVLVGAQWPAGTHIVMHLGLGVPPSPLLDGSTTWDSVADAALADWNTYLSSVRFYDVINDPVPVSGDRINSVFFSSTVFGQDFAPGVLAITTRFFSRTDITEADVSVNSAYPWDSYRGNLQTVPDGSQSLEDLRRVLDHEFGHVLGLDHPDENGQSVTALMNSVIGNLDHIVTDDINGVEAMYGTPSVGAPVSTFIGDPFNGVVLGSGYYYSAWFGIYNNQFYPWIYRTDLGFIYVDPIDSDLYLYVVNGNQGGSMGLLYTTRSLYPDVYCFTQNTWLYFGGKSDFFNYTTNTWGAY